LSEGLPIEPKLFARKETGTYVREKWSIQSEPGIGLPFYLLLPKQAAAPYPVVVAPHGHECGKEAYVGLFPGEPERAAAEAID